MELLEADVACFSTLPVTYTVYKWLSLLVTHLVLILYTSIRCMVYIGFYCIQALVVWLKWVLIHNLNSAPNLQAKEILLSHYTSYYNCTRNCECFLFLPIYWL